MSTNQPKLSKAVYELIKVIEFDVEIGDDQLSVRIELFRSTASDHRFRARLWRTEMYRIQSTFPQDESTKQPAHLPSDETVLVDHSMYVRGNYSDFEAENQEAALQSIMQDYQTFLARLVGQGGDEDKVH